MGAKILKAQDPKGLQHDRKLMGSRLFKVTDFGTSRKPLNNTNLHTMTKNDGHYGVQGR